MKNFNVLIIFILTCINISRLYGDNLEDDLDKLREIIKAYQDNTLDPTFLTRKVFTDEGEKSISDSISKYDFRLDVWKPYVYTVFHTMNIALSCEYSKIVYHHIQFMALYFSPCINYVYSGFTWPGSKRNSLNMYFTKFHIRHLYFFSKHSEKMILSLATLMEYTKNIVFKYHDIFRILLSWHAFLHQIKRTKEEPESYAQRIQRLESLMITNLQMEYRLERFLVKHCYRLEDLTNFKREVKENIQIDPVVFLKKKNDIVDFFTIPINESITNKFVINSSKSDFNTLIELLAKELQSKSIEIDWNGKEQDIKLVYESDIITTSDINVIMRFESILLEVLCEIIVWHEIKVLRNIMASNKEEDILNRTNECNIMVQEIQIYIEKKKLVYYYEKPLGLLQFFFHNKKKLAHLCLLMSTEVKKTEVNNTIDDMQNKLKHVLEFNNTNKLGIFLEALSKIVICAYLHPVVLNSYWVLFRLYDSSDVRSYAVENQYLHTIYNVSLVDNFMCKKTLKPLDTLKSIQDQINECIEKKKKKNCFPTDFHEKYNQVIIEIAYITVNTYPPYINDWEKILLTLIHYKENTELFNAVKRESLDDAHIKQIMTIIYNMRNLLLEKLLVKCSCGVLSTLKEIGKCTEPNVKFVRKLKEDITDVNKLKTIPILNEIFKYRDQFQTITSRVQRMLDQFNIDVDFTVCWDGIPKVLKEVHTSSKNYMFDLQDVYDYASYFIKWVISIPSIKLMQLLQIGMNENIDFIGEEDITKVATSLNSFLKIDLLKRSAIDYFFQDLIRSIRLLRSNETMMVPFIIDLIDEFEFINVLEIPMNSSSHSNWVSDFLAEIKLLMTVFDV